MPLQISPPRFGFKVKASPQKSLPKTFNSQKGEFVQVFSRTVRHRFFVNSGATAETAPKTQPRLVTTLVNFFGATFAPAITQW
jgi:hypothetical protein